MRPIYLNRWAAVALLLLPPFCFAQEPRRIDKSRIPTEADSIEKFVPAGWKIEEQVTGDLNGDSVSDYVVKLVEDKPAKDSDDVAIERQRALVIILQQQGGGKLSRAAVADKLLQCTRCGGAFYGISESPANVQIEKGVIVVDQDHGSRDLTNTYYRFRYDAAGRQFILIGFDYAEADRLTAQVVSESTNYVTGVRIVTRSKGNRDIKSSSKIPLQKISIEQVDSEKFEEAAVKRLGLS
jgi:hypothetical protein